MSSFAAASMIYLPLLSVARRQRILYPSSSVGGTRTSMVRSSGSISGSFLSSYYFQPSTGDFLNGPYVGLVPVAAVLGFPSAPVHEYA